MSSDLISARRESVLTSFEAAEKENRLRFLEGDDKATSEYIYENQRIDALFIVNAFYHRNRRVVSIQKKTKVGADGLMLQIAKLMTTHIDNEFVVNPNNVRILTGMSNAGWEKDMIEKAPNCLKNKIFHHGKLSRAELMNMQNGLIIVDEIDTGDKEEQVLHNTLKEAEVLDVEHMVRQNNRFVFISATMIRELYDLYRWGDYHEVYKMTIPPSYIGHTDFLHKGILQEFYDLSTEEEAKRWIQEDIVDYYGNDYRVHIVRVNFKTVKTIQDACIRKSITFRNHTSTQRLTNAEIKEFFKEPLSKHIVLGVKGFFRRANLIPNRWKLRIGAMHELYTETVDNNVQIQGLVGRMTGYWREIIESGHKTGPYRTSIQAVEEYEESYNDPFGENSYQTAGFRKNRGKVTAQPIMLSPHNIGKLKPTEPADAKIKELDNHPTLDVSDAFDTKELALQYITPLKLVGKITKYTLSPENTIPYRDNNALPIKPYDQTNKTKFKNSDVNLGITSEETKNENIQKGEKVGVTCRIMPVMVDNNVKWVCIYLKSAYNVQ
jgi:hypothetical protein